MQQHSCGARGWKLLAPIPCYRTFKERIYIWGEGCLGSLMWSKTLMELIFNPSGEFRWSSKGPVSQIHSPHLHAWDPGIFWDLLKSVQMLKREWGAESNGKLTHLFIPSKTAARVPEFALEDLGSCFPSERPTLGQNTLMMMMMMIIFCLWIRFTFHPHYHSQFDSRTTKLNYPQFLTIIFTY